MITKKEIESAGYEVLPQGGWIRISPENMPRDWEDVCKDFGVSSDCLEIILCVAGVKEVYEEEA